MIYMALGIQLMVPVFLKMLTTKYLVLEYFVSLSCFFLGHLKCI